MSKTKKQTKLGIGKGKNADFPGVSVPSSIFFVDIEKRYKETRRRNHHPNIHSLTIHTHTHTYTHTTVV